METAIPAPAIEFKVAVERQNVSGVQLAGKVNQARIGKVRGQIAILAHNASHRGRRARKLKRNLKDSALDVLQDGLRRSGKSALLDSVTHDFRTPLTSIKAAVTSLLSAPTAGEAQQRELLTIINEERDRLNQLVGDAAEMARLDAGEFELQLEPHQRQGPAPENQIMTEQPPEDEVHFIIAGCRSAAAHNIGIRAIAPATKLICVVVARGDDPSADGLVAAVYWNRWIGPAEL